MALVLPGLLLRALIPVGFMPMFGPNFGVRLTLCEGYAPVPKSMDMSMDTPMDMPMSPPAHHAGGEPRSDKSGTPSHQDHSTCPYGASPTLATLAAWTCLPAPVQSSAASLASSPQIAHFDIAPRAQSPRGPPLEV
jgi:hypothetical protein